LDIGEMVMTRESIIPEWADRKAERVLTMFSRGDTEAIDRALIHGAIAAALCEERDRWAPAATYFDRYCQDEAEDVENCVCGEQQHKDAKAFAFVIATGRPA
jgi:hypothetical protein